MPRTLHGPGGPRGWPTWCERDGGTAQLRQCHARLGKTTECVFFATTLHKKSSRKIIFLYASVTWEQLEGMLSQAILQMAGSKCAQMDLARIILRSPKNLDNTLYQTWLHSEETFWPARGRCIASRRIPAVGGTRTNAATTDNGNCSPPPHLIYLLTYLFVKTIPCGVSNPAKTECTLHKRKRCGCAPDTSNIKGTCFVFLFEHQE